MDTRHPHLPRGTASVRPGGPSGGTPGALLAGDQVLGSVEPAEPGGPNDPAAPRIPGPRPLPESDLADQLDELVRCLARMDEVMDLIEADLDRRELAFAAIVEPLLESRPALASDAAADSAGAGRSQRRGGARPSRARRTTGRRARRARRRGGR